MQNLKRVDSTNDDFLFLVNKLDKDLADRDGQDTNFYAQYNKVDLIRHAVVAYIDEIPVACGAFKPYDPATVEIKRMYVDPYHRQQGLAKAIVGELVQWALSEGFTAAVLETGKRQPEAIRLYHALGFEDTENYGQYIGIDNSVCMRKQLQ